jgi:hypothetical protein
MCCDDTVACQTPATSPLATIHQSAMKPDRWPHDAPCTAEQLATTIREIEARRDGDRDVLLSAFLCTAWPSRQGQSQ